MSERRCIAYGAQTISFEIVRRNRNTLEIAVEPDARIVVAAPLEAPIAAIEAKVRKRAAWVLRQQRFFSQYMPRTPERHYVAGETHLYLGRQYRLKVVLHVQAGVTTSRGHILVRSHHPADGAVTRGLVETWYRERARVKFAERLEINLSRFPDPEAFRPRGIVVRELRQRWGSMSPSHRLLLNRRLIQASLDGIDYVITHELCHMAVPHHGPAFFELLDRILPDWQKRKTALERKLA